MQVLLLAIVIVLGVAPVAVAGPAVQAQLVASMIPTLVGIEHAPGDSRLFLVDQDGRILIYNGTMVLPTPFLNITDRVDCCNERGLLGLAFHPNYASNGYFYVNYISSAPPTRTIIARFQVTADPNVADPDSEFLILQQNQPATNHNGGQLRFGLDGYLYNAFGDGANSNNAQPLTTWLGKILRIDVDSASPYAVPPGNPFAGTPGALPEIWARGLRNLWRFTFDRLTGDMFVADVGQNLWEEVSFQPAGVGGQNYGWPCMEGLHVFSTSPGAGCSPTPPGLTSPVLEYPHSPGGNCSITGGFRYRGAALAAHIGRYFFADLCSGRIWAASLNAGAWTATQVLDTNFSITTFGEDVNGELYFSHHAGSGQLYRLVTAAATPILTVAKSGTGTGLVISNPVSLHCGFVCGVQLAAGTMVTLTATPDAGTTFAGWTGDLDCADGVVTLSADRNCIATFGSPTFTDSPIVAGVTPVKAIHVTELRARIGALRAGAGLAAFNWTNPTLTAGSTIVQAIHVSEMRTALNAVYTAEGLTPPSYTDPVLGAGARIRAVHIAELRSAVLAVE